MKVGLNAHKERERVAETKHLYTLTVGCDLGCIADTGGMHRCSRAISGAYGVHVQQEPERLWEDRELSGLSLLLVFVFSISSPFFWQNMIDYWWMYRK